MADKILHTKALVSKKSVGDDGVIDSIVGSTDVVDRMGDIIDQRGWTLKNFKSNPVILWGHNVGETRPPIGKALKVWIEDKDSKSAKLMFKVKFDLKDNFAVEVFRKIKDGFLNTVSVGFLPTEWEALDKDNDGPWAPKKYLKQDLLELSFVPVPANPEAVVSLRGMKDKRFDPVELKDIYPQQKKKKVKKIKKEEVKEIEKKEDKVELPKVEIEKKVKVKKLKKKIKFVSKKVIRYKDLGMLPESETWDGPGEKAKAEIDDLKLICTWYDVDDEKNKSAYKLPHHKAEGHKVVWRGVTAAMASLLGARDGVDVPEADRRGVYRHLRKHYKQFDKEAPSFKMVQDQVLSKLGEEIHSLTLDREEKHMVRLIKKVIERQKQAKVQKEKLPDKTKILDKQLTDALEVINQALSSYKTDSTK